MDRLLDWLVGACAEEAAVFEVYCPGHRSRVLLDMSRVEALHNTGDGPMLDWRCWCGTRGSLLRGRKPAPTSDAA
jgi:hypothetical protein